MWVCLFIYFQDKQVIAIRTNEALHSPNTGLISVIYKSYAQLRKARNGFYLNQELQIKIDTHTKLHSLLFFLPSIS